MFRLTVWIDYQPGLYQDLFLKYFQYLNQFRTGFELDLHTGSIKDHAVGTPLIDILVLSLDKIHPRNAQYRRACSPRTKLVAFSPKGNLGLRRITPQADWELICPFGLMRLSQEVLASDPSG